MTQDRFNSGFINRFLRKANLGGHKEELREQLVSFLSHSPNIPTFPAVVHQIEKMIRQDDYSLDEVEATARLDPSLAAQIVRAANVTIYGGGNVSHLRGCLQRLGLRQLRKVLCLHGTISSFYDFKVKAQWEQFWIHSVSTARLTELIYPAFAEPTGDEYLAGLLHDSGKLFLQRIFPEEFTKAIDMMKSTQCSTEAADWSVFGFSHADVSSNLCDRWGLGERVLNAVKWHHDPDSAEVPEDSRLLAASLAVADLCANAYQVNLDGVPKVQPEAIEQTPEWLYLNQFPRRVTLDLDIEKEMEAVNTQVASLLSS